MSLLDILLYTTSNLTHVYWFWSRPCYTLPATHLPVDITAELPKNITVTLCLAGQGKNRQSDWRWWTHQIFLILPWSLFCYC